MVDYVISQSEGNTINAIDTITVFKYRESVITSDPTEGELTTTAASVLVDDDNDLVLPRKKRTESRLEIEHSSYTDVESVGLQVWNGAILLAECIIFENNKFKTKRVLELGSGTGLVSIIAAKYSARVICTDLNDDKILKTIEQNFEKNRESVRAEFQVLPFDFSKEWSAEIEAAINETDIIIASELIYDNEISKHLVEVLVKILKKRPTTAIYLSVEKRYVFTLMNQKVEATHYEYFFDLLKKSLSIASSSSSLSLSSPYKLSQIVDIPQYFYEYERCKETELWYLSAIEYNNHKIT